MKEQEALAHQLSSLMVNTAAARTSLKSLLLEARISGSQVARSIDGRLLHMEQMLEEITPMLDALHLEVIDAYGPI